MLEYIFYPVSAVRFRHCPWHCLSQEGLLGPVTVQRSKGPPVGELEPPAAYVTAAAAAAEQTH